MQCFAKRKNFVQSRGNVGVQAITFDLVSKFFIPGIVLGPHTSWILYFKADFNSSLLVY